MVSLHIPSFAPDGIFLCIISFPPSSPCGRLFVWKEKGKERRRNGRMHDVIHVKRERRKRELAFPFPLRGRMSSSFLQQKTKKRKEKENPCFASSSLLSSPQKEWRKVFSSFLSETGKEKDGEQDHHPFLIFPSGRRAYKRGISFLSLLTEVIMSSFLILKTKKKKEENASIHMQESFAFFVQTEEKKKRKRKQQWSFPSPNRGGREDWFLL